MKSEHYSISSGLKKIIEGMPLPAHSLAVYQRDKRKANQMILTDEWILLLLPIIQRAVLDILVFLMHFRLLYFSVPFRWRN
ncbi:hypothetical protein AB840_02735 [Megasphaera cerevisiae DSM 20462]|jgi:hypothetical protein|uniref:Uncharacterized protein n=1 Tax=Megasphaera cerevisiae DSM 20462 TaxID=1122219 RepID=A0A0J6WXX3_9FIRM|nr:hypothetical protein AB840_02735 [Megasphaera cerevisiae DSM 20462]OKY53814.1 hypothetical protein BSR42_05645 [Megasphaera cerevisiae]